MQLRDFRNAHAGEDVWVLGSGASLDDLDKTVLIGRTSIGCSLLPIWWAPTTYAVSKYHELAAQVAVEAPGTRVFVSRHQHGNHAKPTIADTGQVVVFDHPDNPAADFDPALHWPASADELVASWSTLGSALHLAAYMGARTIFVAGVDGGRRNGHIYAAPYRDMCAHNDDENDWLMPQLLVQTRAIVAELQRRYGCTIVAVDPQIGAAA